MGRWCAERNHWIEEGIYIVVSRIYRTTRLYSTSLTAARQTSVRQQPQARVGRRGLTKLHVREHAGVIGGDAGEHVRAPPSKARYARKRVRKRSAVAYESARIRDDVREGGVVDRHNGRGGLQVVRCEKGKWSVLTRRRGREPLLWACRLLRGVRCTAKSQPCQNAKHAWQVSLSHVQRAMHG